MADLELLAKLEELRSGEWNAGQDNGINQRHRDQLYSKIFREGNLDVDALPAGEAGGYRGTTVAVELAAELDDWAFVRREWSRARRRQLEAFATGGTARIQTPGGPGCEALERNDGVALMGLASQDEAAQQFAPTLLFLANELFVNSILNQGAATRDGAREQALRSAWRPSGSTPMTTGSITISPAFS